MRDRLIVFTTLVGDEGARTREKRTGYAAPRAATEMIYNNCFDAYSLNMRKVGF
ncbi:MAG TPA: hypothetical protein VN540_05945 [Clostridia bacterium]|nr:hypothetical protein [Clostridia bacterium]